MEVRSMPPDVAVERALLRRVPWTQTLLNVGAAWAVLFALTFADWREMAHQWWDIDTYNHVLLVPPIIGWLVWMKRGELAKIEPHCWWPGLVWLAGGLLLWLAGRQGEINLVAQAGSVVVMQGAVLAFVGVRAGLVLCFPLFYAAFLVPFGDEMITTLQYVTARMAVALTHASGVPAIVDGLYIDTPAGKFVVAEECSGVKFLVAMVALATLVAWTGFAHWKRRAVFVVLAAVISIIANGVRAWATIYVAQHVGVERAGGFDHIVYGWVFFALVIAVVLGAAWRHFDREPSDAGLTSAEAAAHPLARLERLSIAPGMVLALTAFAAIAFAAPASLV